MPSSASICFAASRRRIELPRRLSLFACRAGAVCTFRLLLRRRAGIPLREKSIFSPSQLDKRDAQVRRGRGRRRAADLINERRGSGALSPDVVFHFEAAGKGLCKFNYLASSGSLPAAFICRSPGEELPAKGKSYICQSLIKRGESGLGIKFLSLRARAALNRMQFLTFSRRLRGPSLLQFYRGGLEGVRVEASETWESKFLKKYDN